MHDKHFSPVRYIELKITLSILMLTYKLRIKILDYVQLNNWHPPHLTLTRLEQNCYIIAQDFKENKRRFYVSGIMYTKGGAREKTM